MPTFERCDESINELADMAGQYFWPDLAPTIELIHDGKSTGPMPLGTFAKASARLAR